MVFTAKHLCVLALDVSIDAGTISSAGGMLNLLCMHVNVPSMHIMIA